MFAKTIINSDAFMEMPASSKLLYFYLMSGADDDGFVNNPKTIMRTVGSTTDDIGILIARKFVIAFDDGVVVIKHWRIHNYIRGDRYIGTKYKEHLSKLEMDENKSYRCTNGIPSDIPTVDQRLTQVRLGKVRLGKDKPPISPKGFDAFWSAYPKKVGKADATKSFKRLSPNDEKLRTILAALEMHKKTDQWKAGKYIPNPATWLNGKRWEDEIVGSEDSMDGEIERYGRL